MRHTMSEQLMVRPSFLYWGRSTILNGGGMTELFVSTDKNWGDDHRFRYRTSDNCSHSLTSVDSKMP